MQCIALDSATILMSRILFTAMRYKSKLNHLSPSSEVVKGVELDEHVIPGRKMQSPATHTTDYTTNLIEVTIKGTTRVS